VEQALSASDFDQLEETFLAKYRPDVPVARISVKSDFLYGTAGAADLFTICNGASFEGGLYRLHAVEEVPSWTAIASGAFAQFSGNIESFAYDWLGRLFALDSRRLVDGQLGVVMLEPGTGQALEIPANFLTFHCNELIEFADAALAREAYMEWRRNDARPLKSAECVGYRVPLFLGGADTVDNMERTDMKVYWEICTQLLNQTRQLPYGTPIKKLSR
jgi:hypothetical protein